MRMLAYALTAIVCLHGMDMHAAPESIPVRQTDSLGASAAAPQSCTAEHNIGNLVLAVSNSGYLGTDYSSGGLSCFTGDTVKSCQFPRGSTVKYLWAGFLWVGGVVNGDTLVSTVFEGWSGGSEFFPDQASNGKMTYRSTITPEIPLRENAVSHQDFSGSYFDTCAACRQYFDPTDKRYHKPIGLRVDQQSYAWDYPHAENAVIIRYTVTNIGENFLHDAYVGIVVDGDVTPYRWEGAGDDIVGHRDSAALPDYCTQRAKLPMGWICDNEGDCDAGSIQSPNVTGTALLSEPSQSQHMSFNWWSPDFNYGSNSFGPMRKSIARDFGTGGTGIPYGDRNKYYLLSNGDIDFNQPFTGKILPSDSVWVFPGNSGSNFAQGAEVRYLLSVGPWDLAPGQQAEIAITYVGGYNLHSTWGNEANLPSHPDIYMNWLNFSDLEKNALNAKWIYDNPGVDTDTDGYAGQYTVCDGDTVWYEGDGVPDLKADWPPPAPTVTVSPIDHGAIVRWNGQAAETRINWFSKLHDFEGYQVCLKHANAWDTVALYDVEDYLRVHWDTTMARWESHEYPYSVDSLRTRYAPAGTQDTTWKPLRFSPVAPFSPPSFPDSLFYFAPVGCNASALGHDTRIRKAYPDSKLPAYRSPAEVPADSLNYYLTTDGLFKFYEYELRLDNLVPADSYAVAVVALSTGRASLSGYNPLTSAVEAATVEFTPFSDSNCCVEITGNVDCSPTGSIDIADLTALIDYLYISLSPPCCNGEANIDGDPEGVIDISDLTQLIDFLYISFAQPAACE